MKKYNPNYSRQLKVIDKAMENINKSSNNHQSHNSSFNNTNPENKEYLFVQMDVCTPSSSIRYEFKNAFSGESLGEKGEIRYDSKPSLSNVFSS